MKNIFTKYAKINIKTLANTGHVVYIDPEDNDDYTFIMDAIYRCAKCKNKFHIKQPIIKIWDADKWENYKLESCDELIIKDIIL